MLSRWLVQQPAHILFVAAAYLVLWVLLRTTLLRTVPKANVIWIPAVLWLAYASWEWLVMTKTPEADIRVDLLLIWPLLAIVTAWALLRAAIGWWSIRRQQ
jgi:hypothetical protein